MPVTDVSENRQCIECIELQWHNCDVLLEAVVLNSAMRLKQLMLSFVVLSRCSKVKLLGTDVLMQSFLL